MKKLASLALALALSLALAVPALALPERMTIRVHTVEELRSALNSNRTIELAPGVYNVYDGYEDWSLKLRYLENVTLVGDGVVEIVTGNQNENVIEMYGCSGVTLENLKIGHTAQIDGCSEGVLYLSDSGGLTVRDCDIYGCGVTGFAAYNTSAVFENTVIRDCSANILEASRSDLTFRRCALRGNGYDITQARFYPALEAQYSALCFEDCDFAENNNAAFIKERDYEDQPAQNILRMTGCTFEGNEWGGEPAADAGSGVEGFEDVSAGAAFAGAVKWAKENGVTTGVSETRFDPFGAVTRAQAVTFLWRAAGRPAPVSRKTRFTDVPADTWYSDAVLWAVEKNIAKGTSNTRFSPDSSVTCGQMLVFLYRALGEPGRTGAGPWYGDAENWAKENGLEELMVWYYDTDQVCPRAGVVNAIWQNRSSF